MKVAESLFCPFLPLSLSASFDPFRRVCRVFSIRCFTRMSLKMSIFAQFVVSPMFRWKIRKIPIFKNSAFLFLCNCVHVTNCVSLKIHSVDFGALLRTHTHSHITNTITRTQKRTMTLYYPATREPKKSTLTVIIIIAIKRKKRKWPI